MTVPEETACTQKTLIDITCTYIVAIAQKFDRKILINDTYVACYIRVNEILMSKTLTKGWGENIKRFSKENFNEPLVSYSS